jgi:hypothetical protein
MIPNDGIDFDRHSITGHRLLGFQLGGDRPQVYEDGSFYEWQLQEQSRTASPNHAAQEENNRSLIFLGYSNRPKEDDNYHRRENSCKRMHPRVEKVKHVNAPSGTWRTGKRRGAVYITSDTA